MQRMRGAMYVEVWVPKEIRHPYPIVFIAGRRRPDRTSRCCRRRTGGPGWAYDFLNQGYTVYMMDYPGQGRRPTFPASTAI